MSFQNMSDPDNIEYQNKYNAFKNTFNKLILRVKTECYKK